MGDKPEIIFSDSKPSIGFKPVSNLKSGFETGSKFFDKSGFPGKVITS
jgi:hypothetical protein